MNETEIEQSDTIYRQRLGTLRSVDDMVAAIYAKLEAAGRQDDTYFFYTVSFLSRIIAFLSKIICMLTKNL